MPDHREAAAALHADVGGELRHDEQFNSGVLIRCLKKCEPICPWAHASVFGTDPSWRVTVSGADHNLARAILRLVVEARERATQTGGGT